MKKEQIWKIHKAVVTKAENLSNLKSRFFYNFTQGQIQPISDLYDLMLCSSS